MVELQLKYLHMNRKDRSIVQKIILCLFVLIQYTSVFAQKVQQDTINGIVYHVYPFSNQVTTHSNYYLARKKTRLKNYSYKEYYVSVFGEDYNKKDFRKAKRLLKLRSFRNRKYRNKQKHLNGQFKKAVRKNPFPLLEQKYSLEHDIIPCLDQIPDGKYVQYFTGYYPMDKNGKSDFKENQVSGIFTIKNNLLHGEAIWLNVKGDTLKKGQFANGLKVGEWKLETRKASYTLKKEDAKLYIERGYPDMDTTIEIVNYSDGYKNGYYAYYQNSQYPILEGSYKENITEGEWKERMIRYEGFGKNKKRIRNNNIITSIYTISTDDVVVKQPIVRKRLLSDDDYLMEYDFNAKYSPSIPFSKLFSINYPKELDIELEEERMNSYEGEIYDEEYYEDEYYDEEYYEEEYYEEDYYDEYDQEYSAYRNLVYDRASDTYISRAKIMDSLGIIFNYKGVYEKRYPNGNLMMRYEFENGKLKSEDTIFWDNGNPYDVVVADKDSNQYIQRVYDYTGKLFKELVFDSIGDFVRVNFEPEKVKYLTIDGYVAEDRQYGKYYFYDKLDTLENELKDSLVIFRSWFKEDTSLLYSRTYDPGDRELRFTTYSALGKPSLLAEIKFSDSFESWTGFKDYKLGDITMHTTSSASYYSYYEKDSIPQRLVNDFNRSFDLTEDYVLKQNGHPFTGEVTLTLNEKEFSMSTGKSIKIILPRSSTMTNKLQKDYAKYKNTGKTKYMDLLNTIDASEFDEDFGNGIFSSLFGGFIGEFVEFPYSDYYEYEMEDQKYNEKKVGPFAKNVKGYMKDGKPQGIWEVRDQFGKLMYEIPFEKGEIHGTLKEYSDIYPRSYDDYYVPSILRDTMPKKAKHYLSATSEYKNGLQNGVYNQYNWIGTINKQVNFKDGLPEGKSFERNKLAYSSLNYKEGALDGYVRTYLTLNGKDSTLLFDLNFQNGLLQGESRSYHTNGKLAKKGFFLNGDAIDDYEAYDTLGFRYHYVKFLYSFPVEEKIWEENELSVRYLFDWRDSIYFQPRDITTNQSLDRILSQLGIGMDYYERPYYGRPTLVDKQGIDYHITKYYPNDTIARDGGISAGKKVGCWKYYSYEGEFLYEVDYFDTIISINDSVQFKAKGILTDYNTGGDKISESHIIEKFEKYDCSHTDHYEVRQLMTIWEASDSLGRMNGYVKNYYDNGVLQNEGQMKNGLPDGVWKFYDPYGKLNQVGVYVLGKRDGRWLGGDLSKTKYLGDICLNPNLPNLEEEIKYREKLLDIVITNYKMGKALNKEFYDVNMNNFEEEEMEEDMEDFGEDE